MNNKKSWIILAIIILVVAVAGYVFFGAKGGFSVASPTATTALTSPLPAVNAGDYQAVFLVNNQVYFGKLSDMNSPFMNLRDIYYLQVNQAIQPQGKTTTANPNINLIKLGGELHGPTDAMRINRDQVLLIEDLRADSNVVKAIQNYQQSQAKAAH